MTNDQCQMKDDRLNRSTPTVETALWILVAVLALVLRLVHLDAAPLNAQEAREAMLSWRAATGQGMPEGSYSPVLLALNVLLFTLCGTSDSLARLWPALLGSALVLTPWLLRQRIGRVGALAASVYLALSPTALVASRQLDGATLVTLGGMALLGGLVRFLEEDHGVTDGRATACRPTTCRPWLAFSAGGLALAVTSSPSAYGLLLTMVLSWLLLAWVWPDERTRRLWERLRPHAAYLLLVLLLAMLALATGLGWNPTGLGVAGGFLPTWIARFAPVMDPLASPLTLLAVYEPLGLLFGLGGLVWAIQHGHRAGALLGLWASLGTLLATLMPGRLPSDVSWGLLPLVMLAGVATESLVQNLRERGTWLSEGLYVPVVVILWIHLALMLGRYATSGRPEDMALALLTAALQVLLAMIFALAMKAESAFRALGVGTGIVLLAITFAAGWRGATVIPADPREIVMGDPTAAEVRDLVQTLHSLSWRETGLPTTMAFMFEAAPDSVLAWYLRDFSAARRVEELRVEEGEGLPLVTERHDLSGGMLGSGALGSGALGSGALGSGALGSGALGSAAQYVGQDFVLQRSWDLGEIMCAWEWPPRCNAAVKWWMFRSTPTFPVAGQWAVLWLSGGTEPGDTGDE
jgi:uncharacterized protein (TIGR03663 family)